ASALGVVYNHDIELFWKIADAVAAAEKTNGVLSALVNAVGQAYIARQEPKKVVSWLKKLIKRRPPSRRSRKDVLTATLDSVLYLYVYLNEPTADQLLHSLEKNPKRYSKQLE